MWIELIELDRYFSYLFDARRKAMKSGMEILSRKFRSYLSISKKTFHSIKKLEDHKKGQMGKNRPISRANISKFISRTCSFSKKNSKLVNSLSFLAFSHED